MMKKLFILIAVGLVGAFYAPAQTNDEIDIETSDVQLQMITPAEPVKESKEEIKEREKKIRELNDDIAYAKAANSLRRGYFVLIANNIEFGNMGYRRYDINSNSNFILVQGEDGIFQFALNTYRGGANGIGGSTQRGTVRNKHIKYDDNGDVHMDYQLVSGKTNAFIYITLYHNSNYAVARISGGTPITVYGEILPYRDKDHR
ncbi:MAG: DUF4251 domain-containing protein [Muribaculaceae bacterium]|nr:DUF4251 domain-containing protein [Muribaculaceae bacterium]